MNCRTARSHLSASIDNELSAGDARALRGHLESCVECAERLAAYQRIRAGIRSLPMQLPPVELREAIFRRATPAFRRRALYVGLGQRVLATSALVMTVAATVFTASSLIANTKSDGLGSSDIAPRVVSVEPRSGTIDWAPGRAIRVTFNKPMDHATVAAALRISIPSADGEVEATYLRETLQWEGDTLILGAHGGLRPDTDYYIEFVPGVARDRRGNTLSVADTKLAFRTALVLTARDQATATANTLGALPAVAQQVHGVTPHAPTNDVQATRTAPVGSSATLRARSTALPPSSPMPLGAATATVIVPPQTASAPPAASPLPTSPPLAEPAAATPARQAATPAVPDRRGTPKPSPGTAAAASAAGTTELPRQVPSGFGALYDSSAAVRSTLGAPTGPATTTVAITLRFERGLMYRRSDTATIYVLFFEKPGVWFAFADTWVKGDPDAGGSGPVAGQFVPKEGFGAVWNANADFRQRLGYALSAEGERADALAQPFERGAMFMTTGNGIFVLATNGTYERYADPRK